jgi:hypothetical protein
MDNSDPTVLAAKKRARAEKFHAIAKSYPRSSLARMKPELFDGFVERSLHEVSDADADYGALEAWGAKMQAAHPGSFATNIPLSVLRKMTAKELLELSNDPEKKLPVAEVAGRSRAVWQIYKNMRGRHLSHGPNVSVGIDGTSKSHAAALVSVRSVFILNAWRSRSVSPTKSGNAIAIS